MPQSTVISSPAPRGRQRLDGLDGDAVAVLEATGQERLDLGAQQPQHLDGERRGADAVDVVVAVHDDRPAGRDRTLDQRAGLGDVAQRERIVQRAVALEERPRRGRIGQPAPHQHLCRDPLQAELGGEPAHLVGAARRDRERRGHPANLGLGPDAAPRAGRSGWIEHVPDAAELLAQPQGRALVERRGRAVADESRHERDAAGAHVRQLAQQPRDLAQLGACAVHGLAVGVRSATTTRAGRVGT